MVMWAADRFKRLGQWIRNDETNTYPINLFSRMKILGSIGLWRFLNVRVGVAIFLGQSIGIDETNTF